MAKLRSGDGVFAQADLFGGGDGRGVGGRQGKGRLSDGGGEYPKNCGFSNFQIRKAPPSDPRLDELVKIGIGGPWLRLARRIGFDAFLEVWRAISEDECTRHDGARRMPKLREYASYLRFQRNQYVRSLAASGMEPLQVRKLVEKQFGERLSVTQVQRLMRGEGDRFGLRPDGESAPPPVEPPKA